MQSGQLGSFTGITAGGFGGAPSSGGGGGDISTGGYVGSGYTIDFYNVGGPSSTDYEKETFEWTGNVFKISNKSGGTGVATRGIQIAGGGSGVLDLNSTVGAKLSWAANSLQITSNGSLFTGSISAPTVSAVATTGTLGVNNFTFRSNATIGPVTLTLPLASAIPGVVYAIRKIDGTANTVTITAAGADTIDGAATKVLATQWATVIIQSNGTTWDILSAS